MTDQGAPTPSQGTEPSPAEKLAQPVAQDPTGEQQANAEPADKKQKTTSIKSEGVPVAKLSGIGVPVAVVLFVLAFLWKGPVFAVGVLAAIALALAVIWAVRTVASRPAARNTTREPRSPRNPRSPRAPGAPPRNPRGGDRGGDRSARQNGDRSRLRPPWQRRQNNDTKPPSGDNRRKPPGKQPPKPSAKDGPKGRQPATTPTRDRAPGGKPGPTGPARNGQPGRPGNQPAGSKPPGKNPTKPPQGATTKPPGSKPGSSPSRLDGGKPRGSQPPKPTQLVKNIDPAPSRAKDKPGEGSRGRGSEDRNRGNTTSTSKPDKTGDKTTTGTKKPKGKEQTKPKKNTVDTPAPPRRGPVSPRLQWVVNPDTPPGAPTDPKILALADKVRAAGGAAPTPPGVASLQDKRMRNLGDAIRDAGGSTSKPSKTKNNPLDGERFNAVYGHMIELSSPQAIASSLRNVSETATRDQIDRQEKAEEMRATAAGLPDNGYDEVKSGLLARAAELDEDAENRGHWAVATAERATHFESGLTEVL